VDTLAQVPRTRASRGTIALSLATAVVVGAVAAGSANAHADALTPTARHELLQRFIPILYFHASEVWAPVAVERFLRLARVERQTAPGRWMQTASGLPTSTAGCTSTPCYRFNLPCSLKAGASCYERAAPTLSDWKRPTIYGRVLEVPAGTAMPAGITGTARYLVRYWLFYSFDDWRSRGDRLWQAHEGDWENISVALDDHLDPIFAAYSQHCSGAVLGGVLANAVPPLRLQDR